MMDALTPPPLLWPWLKLALALALALDLLLRAALLPASSYTTFVVFSNYGGKSPEEPSGKRL